MGQGVQDTNFRGGRRWGGMEQPLPPEVVTAQIHLTPPLVTPFFSLPFPITCDDPLKKKKIGYFVYLMLSSLL